MLVSLRIVTEGLNADVEWSGTTKTLSVATHQQTSDFTVTSPVLVDKKQINGKYIHNANPNKTDISLPLSWSHAPKGTKSFAVAIYDFHPIAVNFLHWGVVNIPVTTTSLAEGSSKTTMPKGSNEVAPYFGPAPPPGSGDHFYKVVVYALDTDKIKINTNSGYFEDFESALKGHIIAQTYITGYYKQ